MMDGFPEAVNCICAHKVVVQMVPVDRAVAAYLKVVRRRKSSSADDTRGERARERTPPLFRGVRGLPRENFEFLALLCGFFMRLGPDFSHDFLLEKTFLGA